ncbi:nitroreductase [Bacillus sp. SLBN-46]|uniref:nitroreductase family protein n=1 Tax=Bacillus sp. SLBN-46 TaxID=3042283 RepID=UPI00285B6B64|nr:nitroreductase family protein [Bacillus sp. SLBN-46]MDR6121169.1 nitroreductase [Bacillus sp. SLBN-46]
MIKVIKRIIPISIKQKIVDSKLLTLVQLIKNYSFDMKKFIKYSGTFNAKKTKQHYEASLIFYYHKIEKGLSLPKPRIGFGKDNVDYLVSLLEEYYKKYGWDDISKVTLNTLYAYYYFNEENGLLMKDLFNRIECLNKALPLESEFSVGGVQELSKADINKSYMNFKEFAYSRYSIRNFAPGEVSLDLIEEAINIAQKTPSVCNRQTSRVYVYNDEKLKREVLRYQNGNAGFGESASKILIVTSKIENFMGVHERYQSYIDGGMYSMSLIYALHSLGLGTCPLNLAITEKVEKDLKKAANIGNSDVLIMMIAVGNLPEKLKVASSHRRNASEVLKVF